jgi:serine/threonine protein kinase
MAEVYRVWDEDRASYLALKLLRDDLAEDRVFLRRFKREAQTLAKLQHPNIVRFYGLEQDGMQAFMLMDFVEGTSLRTEIFKLDGKPMPPGRILTVMRPVCSALHFAHNQGMVHCDIKPANIMIEKTGRVLVTDFGIARMTDAATATMVGAGTPAYMAPEQVQGVDPAPSVDVYAMGVVLFEMLSGGERPFTGEHAQTTGSTSEKVRWEQVNLMAPSIRRFNPKVSPEMEAVVARALAKNPADRYPTAFAFMEALEAAMAAEGVSLVVPAPAPAPQPAPPPPVAQPAQGPAPIPRVQAKPGFIGSTTCKVVAIVSAIAAVVGIGLIVLWATSASDRAAPSSDAAPSETADRMPTTAPLPTWTPRPTATDVPEPTATPRPQPTATPHIDRSELPSEARNWRVLRNDTYSNSASGWGDVTSDTYYGLVERTITGGKLLWESEAEHSSVSWVYAPVGDLSDFYVAVDIQLVSGSSTAQEGLIFRMANDRAYVFLVFEDQRYGFWKLDSSSGDWVTLIYPTINSVIRQGEVNRIAVLAQGGTFSLYINGRLVVTKYDGSYDQGQLGIIAGLWAAGRSCTWEIDNFLLLEP